MGKPANRGIRPELGRTVVQGNGFDLPVIRIIVDVSLLELKKSVTALKTGHRRYSNTRHCGSQILLPSDFYTMGTCLFF